MQTHQRLSGQLLKAGTVEIFEVGADGNRVENAENRSPQTRLENSAGQIEDGQQAAEVNQLMVVNRSGKPLYLMLGEVIVGGQQDRSIAQETVIAASEKAVPIDVYCVEQGHWSQRGATDDVTTLALLSDASFSTASIARLSKDADRGKFVISAGSLNKEARLAAQSGEGQAEIWKKVALANSALKVSTMSGAFTQNYVDPDVRKQLAPYIDTLRQPVAERRRIVGVLIAINGKIQAVDVFESTPLFRKLWPKLLKSYALDAVAMADDSKAEKPCTDAVAKAFLDACATAAP